MLLPHRLPESLSLYVYKDFQANKGFILIDTSSYRSSMITTEVRRYVLNCLVILRTLARK